ncbi:MAG TPA: SpoIID/LytB domain-containing protein [Candidatus Baltobacteraceae bacterium]|nr:SpoIID/LytB domain-containing protein [Candidatus Baltobacteraceae bacterium]
MRLKRGAFVAMAAAALGSFGRARAQSDADPAISAPTPSLRVLLGHGQTAPGPDAKSFVFDGQPYRGSYLQIAGGAIVNLVDVEEYLYSVVPREMPSSWPAAALRAQATCARTYVLQRSDPRRAYDLVPSELDQVYRGLAGESPDGRAAVDATLGDVLRFDGRFATVAYSSCCGGHTEASSDAWGGAPLPYLGGVPCPFCMGSPNYRWTTTIPLGDVERRFEQQLAALGRLQTVTIAQRDASGRASSFELQAERGGAVVKGSAFRLAMGPRTLRSLLISDMHVEASGALVIEGGGLGHGVGMCQWGARGMALAGRTARDILMWYFPGTELGND